MCVWNYKHGCIFEWLSWISVCSCYAVLFPLQFTGLTEEEQLKGSGCKMANRISRHWRYQIAQPCCIWKVNEGEEEATVVYLSVSGAGYSLSGVLSKMSFTSLPSQITEAAGIDAVTRPINFSLCQRCPHSCTHKHVLTYICCSLNTPQYSRHRCACRPMFARNACCIAHAPTRPRELSPLPRSIPGVPQL